jgi:Protein of unknown function (DUF5132)
MEYYVVTKIKNPDVVKKIKATAVKSANVLNKAIATKTRKPRRAAVNKTALEDTAYTEAHDATSHAATSHASQSATAKQNISHMIARGKDLVSGDNTSLAAAAVIVLGAALIEVELIPGLVIGAGAILLGKLFPEAGHYVRPAIKSALRAGFSLTQKVQEVLAETSEQVHDLVAEVMHEQKHTSVDQPLASVVESGRDHTTKA